MMENSDPVRTFIAQTAFLSSSHQLSILMYIFFFSAHLVMQTTALTEARPQGDTINIGKEPQ